MLEKKIRKWVKMNTLIVVVVLMSLGLWVCGFGICVSLGQLETHLKLIAETLKEKNE